MAKYKATVSFSGLKLAMTCGEVREISDPSLVANLIKAGQIIEVVETPPKAKTIPVPEPQPKPEPKDEPKEAKKSSRKGKKS